MKTVFTLSVIFLFLNVHAQGQNKAGTLDSSFGNHGITITTLQNGSLDCQDATTQKNGKIICAGSGGHDSVGGFAALRYTADGVLDSTFGNNGISYVNFTDYQMCYAVCVQPDDKIVMTGYGIANIFDPTYFILTCRLNADGSLDSSFGTNGKIIDDDGEIAYDVALQPDGKIVVTGNCNTGIITLRYLSDGMLDKSFGKNGIVKSLSVSAEARTNLILPDGKILVGADDFNQLIFVRYNVDGSTDKNFGNNGILYSNVYKHNEAPFDMILQPDSKVLVAGEASSFISDSSMLVRYMPDGSLDSSFGTNGVVLNTIPYTSTPSRIKLQHDGKVLMAGVTGGTETQQHFLVARFNNNGSIDSSFSDSGYQITEVSKSDGATGLIIQQNGKIVLAGGLRDFNNINGVALARYNNDINKKQTLITKIKRWLQHHNGIEWDKVNGINSYVVQRSYDGIHFKSIATIHAGNAYNYTYEDASQLNNTNYYRLQTTSINGSINYSNVIAITNDDIKISPNPATNILRIQGLLSNQKIKLTVVDFAGNVAISQQLKANSVSSYNLNIASLKQGNYLLKIETNDDVVTKQIVKK